jgi:hypothetical protein
VNPLLRFDKYKAKEDHQALEDDACMRLISTGPDFAMATIRILKFIGLLVMSYLLFCIPIVIEQTFWWTDHWLGFVNGLIFSLFFGPIAWGIVSMPITMLLLGVCRWRKWVRWRALILLSPAITYFIFDLPMLFVPHTPESRFEHIVGAPLPASAHDLKVYFSGGLFADTQDWFYFRCAPDEAAKLIKLLGLKEVSPDYEGGVFLPPPIVRGEWPNPITWVGGKYYTADNMQENRYFQMYVDHDGQQIYFVYYNI